MAKRKQLRRSQTPSPSSSASSSPAPSASGSPVLLASPGAASFNGSPQSQGAVHAFSKPPTAQAGVHESSSPPHATPAAAEASSQASSHLPTAVNKRKTALKADTHQSSAGTSAAPHATTSALASSAAARHDAAAPVPATDAVLHDMPIAQAVTSNTAHESERSSKQTVTSGLSPAAHGTHSAVTEQHRAGATSNQPGAVSKQAGALSNQPGAGSGLDTPADSIPAGSSKTMVPEQPAASAPSGIESQAALMIPLAHVLAPTSGSWLQPGKQAVARVRPSAEVSTMVSRQHSTFSQSPTRLVSAVKPHARTAFAKPGSHRSAVRSPQSVDQHVSAKPLMSHRLEFSDQDTDEDSGIS